MQSDSCRAVVCMVDLTDVAYVWAAWRLCRVEIHMLETPEEILVPLEPQKSEHIWLTLGLVSGLG